MKQLNRVVVTGATGFLGSHIAELLTEEGYEVYGTKRCSSNLSLCSSFSHKINWIDADKENWMFSLEEISPNIIIHSMWIGVDAANRNDKNQQLQNCILTEKLLGLSNKLKISKFIGLGSQAEYGKFFGKITEESPLLPESAYGVAKNMCANMTRIFCEENNIKWFWLRLFPLFGERESEKWLIPSIIKAILTQNAMDFTLGEQKYAYLYVKDFAKAVLEVVKTNACSGIYNVSSSNPLPLKKIITDIRDKINPSFQLNFGKLPYRQGQSMHIEGNVSKFEKWIAKIPSSNFDENLDQTIAYYKKLYNE
jgi:nucleoside-diphosphate-sugar epimerase